MRIFKAKLFAKFARRERASLIEAVERAERGLVDADLGGGLFKQRVARQGQGRSGGYRTLIACRFAILRCFFSASQNNIDDDELAELRAAGGSWLAADKKLIGLALRQGLLIEVKK